jgi:D-aminopeptidase
MTNERPRARDIGLRPGRLTPGKSNSITDVKGVRVGHETIISGDEVRTGITSILPHPGNLFQEKVPAAIFVENGFGKLVGSTQVNELGEIETPILLTNTLCVPRVADFLIDYMLSMKGNDEVTSINPVVGETNDGFLNNIRNKNVEYDHVTRALDKASTGPVEEGCVGAGTGTRALGFKGGIGTSSRYLSPEMGGYTVGVLVQTNYGGFLTVNGAPVGRELREIHRDEKNIESNYGNPRLGSVMVIIATDAPLSFRNLQRLGMRSALGLTRTGFISENKSGDYFIVFSTAEESRVTSNQPKNSRSPLELRNDQMDPLFLGAIEATEEAVYNSLFRATTTKGFKGRIVEALPIEATQQILRAHAAI